MPQSQCLHTFSLVIPSITALNTHQALNGCCSGRLVTGYHLFTSLEISLYQLLNLDLYVEGHAHHKQGTLLVSL